MLGFADGFENKAYSIRNSKQTRQNKRMKISKIIVSSQLESS
jgi:hypothetical protein